MVKRGAYYANQENVLIAVINNDNMTIFELGFRRILKARQESEETPRNSSIIWQFDVPEINIKAEHYSGLLHWERDHQRTEPPITIAISKEELCASWMKNCSTFHVTLKQSNCASNLAKCMGKIVEMVLFEQLNRAEKCHNLSQRKT